ncbi:MAG: hypothetical protein PWP44_874 [Thermacetogenium sp.]|nr:hypothetical protein [Thermacetogenium sp.]
MNEKEKIEAARKILNNAYSLNLSKDVLLRISRLIDKYVVAYHKKENRVKKEKKQSNDSGR